MAANVTVTLNQLAASLGEEHQLTKRAGRALLDDLISLITKQPAGEAKSAPTLAVPITPASQPTPARTRNRFSAGMYCNTLQYSAPNPSAVMRAVRLSISMKLVPCRARTPSSASSSCWRIRWRSARLVRSLGSSSSGFGSTTGFPLLDEVIRDWISHSATPVTPIR
jgi:hypothetical protein